MATPTLTIQLFSVFAAEVDGTPIPGISRRKSQWLLALLALRQGREVSREWLAETLWPDSDPSQALGNLRQSLANDLRPALGASASRLRAPTKATLCLDASEVWVDVTAFDTHIAAGTAEDLERAVSLYRGPLLPDCQEEWARTERHAREQAYLTALERLAQITWEKGEPSATVRWLRLLLVTDPYRESAYCALMQALADCGDQAAVTHVYRDLRLLLHRDLNAQPAPETEALYKTLQASQNRPMLSRPASSSPAGPPRRLPVPLSDLIGREEELEEICGWMRRNRLVTLVGPGGVGKTRLSIAAAGQVIGQFPDGVWFVDLAPLNDPALLPQTILRTLDIEQEPNRLPEETLERTLSSRPLLLVLDNCEHLVEVCALLTQRLLASCPHLRVLATSREALGLTGEHLYPVPTLSLPLPGQPNMEKAASTLLEYAGVRLFVERAKQGRPAFHLNRSNADQVVQICQQLDGIPLAIEMAAARVKSLTLGQIFARLEDRFQLLTGGSRAALPRQRTLQAAIDWSYDLLSEAERLLFRRLSVFAGSWSLEAAEAVCTDKGGRMKDESKTEADIHPSEVLELLTNLLEKSLVVFEERGEEVGRYRFLETVRAYAREKLEESRDAEAVRERHGEHFLGLAEQAYPVLNELQRDPDWHDRLELEHDNLRVALVTFESYEETLDKVVRLAAAMAPFWGGYGYSHERQRWLVGLAMRSTPPTLARLRLLKSAGEAATEKADFVRARHIWRERLELARQLGELSHVSGALNGLSMLEEDPEVARQLVEESLVIVQELGDRAQMAHALYHLGTLARERGDADEAQSRWMECMAIDQELGVKGGHVVQALGSLALERGDYSTAQHFFQRFVVAQHENSDLWCLGWGLEGLSALALAEGQPERSACFLGASFAMKESISKSLSEADRASYEARKKVLRVAADESVVAAAWERGRLMSQEQIVEYALT